MKTRCVQGVFNFHSISRRLEQKCSEYRTVRFELLKFEVSKRLLIVNGQINLAYAKHNFVCIDRVVNGGQNYILLFFRLIFVLK